MRTVLLFYDGFELHAAESRSGKLYQKARSLARRIWRTAKGKQVYTGFYAAFQGLVKSLEECGCKVRVNDFAAARAHPDEPIGIVGYPSVLAKAGSLPNPKLFGPGDPGFPKDAERAAVRYRLEKMIQPCEWAADLYRAECGDRMVVWPAGIDTAALAPARSLNQKLDVLVYDKIRWNGEHVRAEVLNKLTGLLDSRGLSYKIIQYGSHTQRQFFALAGAAKSMAFVCEHETQGLACEEVLGMNIPVFAWDEGDLIDPIYRAIAPANLTVTSVPYWDQRCGERFTVENMERQFIRFWSNLATYRPREYVEEALSLRSCGRRYLAILDSIAPMTPDAPVPVGASSRTEKRKG